MLCNFRYKVTKRIFSLLKINRTHVGFIKHIIFCMLSSLLSWLAATDSSSYKESSISDHIFLRNITFSFSNSAFTTSGVFPSKLSGNEKLLKMIHIGFIDIRSILTPVESSWWAFWSLDIHCMREWMQKEEEWHREEGDTIAMSSRTTDQALDWQIFIFYFTKT